MGKRKVNILAGYNHHRLYGHLNHISCHWILFVLPKYIAEQNFESNSNPGLADLYASVKCHEVFCHWKGTYMQNIINNILDAEYHKDHICERWEVGQCRALKFGFRISWTVVLQTDQFGGWGRAIVRREERPSMLSFWAGASHAMPTIWPSHIRMVQPQLIQLFGVFGHFHGSKMKSKDWAVHR